jgi:DNA-binding beta-propeller fold protein YncE
MRSSRYNTEERHPAATIARNTYEEMRFMLANSTAAPPKASGASRIGWIAMWVISIGLLVFLITMLAIRFTTPIPLYRLRVLQDIPLPSALPDSNRTSQNPLTPGLAVRFDHFDFQALDPQTHLLFLNHSGPSPDKASTVNITVDPANDGNVLVFNTVQHKLVNLLPIPQTSGITVAPDIHWVYISDAQDSIIYAVDESTFKMVQIKLDPLDGPDASIYDPVDHRLFVSDPGAPISDDNANIALKNQNVAVIDTIHNTLIGKVPLGIDKPFGDDVGHVQYDATTHRLYVVTLPLHDQNALNPDVTPPSYLDVVDPVQLKVTTKIKLPDACLNPHGMVVDTDQQVAFIACVDNDKLVRVNLRTLQPFPDATLQQLPEGCDIVRLDHPLHTLFVGCATGIAMFNEANGQLTSLGSQFVGGNSNHTILINEETQEIYVPLPSSGDRPILRILQYVPNGTESST